MSKYKVGDKVVIEGAVLDTADGFCLVSNKETNMLHWTLERYLKPIPQNAAAPDLLAELESLVDKVESAGWHKSETEAARAAIAKAKGGDQ